MITLRKVFFYIILAYLGLILFVSIFAPLLAPSNPLDSGSIHLSDSKIPPIWMEGGDARFLLGTDNQGKDILSVLLYSIRISLFIAVIAVLLSMMIGTGLGLISGYFGGLLDVIIMRLVDVKLALPAILLAMLVGGVMRNVFNVEHIMVSVLIIIVALTIATWSIYTRSVRSIVIREKQKEYVSAARLMGLSHVKIILNHILPNVRGMIGVIMIIDLANCIMLESTLSFLGIGLSPSIPSLGTTIKIGTEYFLSGTWWMVVFPSVTLILLIYSINYVKDYIQEKQEV